jgi:flagellar biosynthesis protein FliP
MHLPVSVMILIRDLVQKALADSYLTIEAEEELRQLLLTKYSQEDLKAFLKLQQAAMDGYVKQESRVTLLHRI